MSRVIKAAACLIAAASGASVEQREAALANPIRKVVTMLQDMQRKVTEEGKKEQELYDKFMCFCKTNGGDLSGRIQGAQDKIESTTSALQSAQERKVQTEADLKEHQQSRKEAEDTMASATAIREKEAAAFAKVEADLKTNLAALAKAVDALERGVAGGFLQTPAAAVVRTFAMERADLPDATRQEIVSFLSGSNSEGYAPQSGEIIGILKQIGDEMKASLKDATDTEQAAIQNYEELMAAKKKEVAALQAQIESEMERIGRLGVETAEMANDIEDTKNSLAADEQFKLELEKDCKTKTAEWEEIKANRAEELVALADTIRVLNDDDALELFKKTLPSAAASFVQVAVSGAAQRVHALELLQRAARQAKSPGLDLILLALRGKQGGFEKVIAMIDQMVSNLHTEQQGDDSKKEYCEHQLDESDDKRKALEQTVSDADKAIEELEGLLASVKADIKDLEAGIKELDHAVADATEQRKSQNEEFKALMAADSTAKDVLAWAKNRLNKFYNKALYKPPPKRELSEEERISTNFGGTLAPTPAPGGIAGTGIGASFVQIRAHSQVAQAPEAPQAPGPFKKKSQESNGVIAMIDLLIKDLDKEMQEADVSERDAQADYEHLMADAGEKRAADVRALDEKAAAKANAEEELDNASDKKVDATKELMATMKYIKGVHDECDWLLKYYEARKEARASEIDSLKNAKAVLSGADYSLAQTTSAGFLAKRK